MSSGSFLKQVLREPEGVAEEESVPFNRIFQRSDGILCTQMYDF